MLISLKRISRTLKRSQYIGTSLFGDRPTSHTLEVNGNTPRLSTALFTFCRRSTVLITSEIRRRVTLGNRSYYSLQKHFRSKTLNRNLNCKQYRSLVRSVVAYGSEHNETNKHFWCSKE